MFAEFRLAKLLREAERTLEHMHLASAEFVHHCQHLECAQQDFVPGARRVPSEAAAISDEAALEDVLEAVDNLVTKLA